MKSSASDQTDFDFQTVSWDHIHQANRATLSSFQLELFEQEHIVYCNEVVRVIPGKRLVAFGKWNNKPIVAKLFYSRKAAKHAKREYEGIKSLQTLGVLTPAVFYYGVSADRKVYVLLFDKINGQSLADIWDHKTSLKQVTPLLRALTIEVATQHVLGVLQNDLHFKNFIVKGKRVYSIDAGDLKTFTHPLPKKESLENLALFFSQMGAGTKKLHNDLYKVYAGARGWLLKKNDIGFLHKTLNKLTKKRLADYAEKTLRTSTQFVRKTNFSAISIYDRHYESADLLEFLAKPDKFLTADKAMFLKEGRSATVAKITLHGKAYVLKRFNIKNIWHALRRAVRTTRAMNAWQLAHRLNLLGIATAKPVAVVTNSILGFSGTSYLLMEYVEGEHLGQYFRQHMDKEVANEVGRVIQNLAECNITHGDLKMTNIIISQRKPILIDLDGMRQHKTRYGFAKAYAQEVERFMRNWEGNASVKQLFDAVF